MKEYIAERLSYAEIERRVREMGNYKPEISISEDGYWVIDGVKTDFKAEVGEAPVQSVNGKTGNVELSATDVGARPYNWTPSAKEVGARPDTWMPSYEDVGAEKSGTAASLVNAHNANNVSHNEIRVKLQSLANRINAVLDSDDTTLDALSEIVAYIKKNKSLIDGITASKVNVADIINNLFTNMADKPLSAAQGVVLKGLIDDLDTAKLDASALTTAINNALAQAKASGAFDGEDGVGISSITKTGTNGKVDTYTITLTDKTAVTFTVTNGTNGENGTSVTVKTVSESPSDGGINVITFSDGTIIEIKNGKGGTNGVGIETIKRTSQYETYDVYTIELTNGNKHTFEVHHGRNGTNGKTPVYGVDYFTPEDIANIVERVHESIGTPIFGIINAEKEILLSGKDVPIDNYTVAYINEDGSKTPIGPLELDTNVYYSVTKNLTNCGINNSAISIAAGSSYSATITANNGYELSSVTVTMGDTNITASAVSGGNISIASVTGNIVINAVAEVAGPAYTNQIPLSVDTDGTPFNNGKGYLNGYRLSASSASGYKENAGTAISGFMPCTSKDTIEIKNVYFDRATDESKSRSVFVFDANKTKLNNANLGAVFQANAGVDKGNGVYSGTLAFLKNSSTEIAYFRICSTKLDDTSIITINQPITD